MRREGYEFSVSRPRVITKQENGHTLEPYELLMIDVPGDYAGAVIEKLGQRRAEIVDMSTEGGVTRICFDIPARRLVDTAASL